MKKFVMVLIVLIVGLMIIGCSTGEQRNKIVEKIGEVLYQRYPEAGNTNDVFVVRNLKNELLIVYVDSDAKIWEISKIKEE